MIVIIAALPQEFAGLKNHLLEGVWSEHGDLRFCAGRLCGRRVALIVSGVGADKAAGAARFGIERFSPQAVVSIGFAGGLAPEAAPGTLILPDKVMQEHPAPAVVTPDARLLLTARSAAASVGCRTLGGTVLTVPAIVAKRNDKKDLHVRTGVVAVEMESAAVGSVCREKGIPVVFFRCVTDGVHDEIPVNKEISAAFRGRLNLLPLLWWLLKHPAVAAAIWHLYRRAHRASRLLSRLVLAFCRHLPQPF